MLDIDRLYRDHWPALYRFLRRRMPGAPAPEVEDLTADVFLRVCQAHMRAYREEGKEVSWLYKIAQRLLIDRGRRLANRVQETALDPDAATMPATADAGTWQQIDALDVAQAMAFLPPRWRQVLLERYYLSAPPRDTAALLECSVDNVARIHKLALERLDLLLRRGAGARRGRPS